MRFPINRRHQRMATRPWPAWWSACWLATCFQSIGVTKEWRLAHPESFKATGRAGFQSIGVTKEWRPSEAAPIIQAFVREFPINRRHQRMATIVSKWKSTSVSNPRFQSIGVTKEWRPSITTAGVARSHIAFPINRRHQRMATRYSSRISFGVDSLVSNQ